MNAAARLVVRNMNQFRKELDSADKSRVKAGQTAAKVEGFRLKKVLAKELRSGSPGGRQLQPLRRLTTGARKRNPLARFAKAVRYRGSGSGKNYTVEVGFLTWRSIGTNDNGKAYDHESRNSSGSTWRRRASMQQHGYSFSADAISPIGSTYRRLFRRIGQTYGKLSAVKKYFFLKKSTKNLVVPARPMIDPFWSAHKTEASRNILNNFKRKMQGEHI